MTRLIKVSAALFALAAMLSLVTIAHAGNKNASLKDVDLGTHIYGPKVTEKDLTGQVVIYKYWGDRCSTCLRSIPHLVELKKEHGDKLTIVANQIWNATDEDTKSAWVNAKGSADITIVNKGGLKDVEVKATPTVFVFDHQGKLLWEGVPLDPKFDAIINKAVSNVPG